MPVYLLESYIRILAILPFCFKQEMCQNHTMSAFKVQRANCCENEISLKQRFEMWALKYSRHTKEHNLSIKIISGF